MYRPPPISEMLIFPTGEQNKHIKLPKREDIQMGDILVAKYNSSRWARWLPYALISSKWNETSWYCSSIIYKSYSRTITGMYLESYDDIRAGFFVTPEDLLDSKRTEEYFTWEYKGDILIEA